MRVPEEILNTVAYIFFVEEGDMDSSRRAIGTGFFVSIESKTNEKVSYVYFVTAKHCIATPLTRGRLSLRLNTIEGGCDFVQLQHEGWLYSDDPASDIAVLPFAPDSLRFTGKYIHHTMLGTEEKLALHGIGIGDEVVISGLFTRRAGRQRNLPIIRCGCIAAIPGEQIVDSSTGLSYSAYLIEARSIGGLSGSPVFVVIAPGRVNPVNNTINFSQRFVILIGVIRGHWEHREAANAKSAFLDELAQVNLGIAAVTPSTDLVSILFGKKLLQSREESDIQWA